MYVVCVLSMKSTRKWIFTVINQSSLRSSRAKWVGSGGGGGEVRRSVGLCGASH
jgi:hypothetical protein